MIRKYNPKRIVPNFMGVKFLGLMDGTFFEVEYEEDAVTTHVGAQGDVSLILNANQLARGTVTIVQGSPTNLELFKRSPNPGLGAMPSGPFDCPDLNGSTVVHSSAAVIQKVAKVEFGKTILGWKWMFILPEALIVPGAGGE